MISYITLVFFFILNLFLDLKIKIFFYRKCNVLVNTKKQYFISLVVCMFFFFFFFFIFRVVRLFFVKNYYFSSVKLFDVYYTNITLYGHDTVFSLIIFFIYLFFIIRKLLTKIVKFHFLRLFYLFYGSAEKIIYKLAFFFEKKKLILSIINFCVILLFLSVLLQFFFFKVNDIFIGFLPYVALYYFIYNCINTFKLLNSEFDNVTAFIYKGLNISEECFFKLKEYHMFIIFNESEYIFVTSIDSRKNTTESKSKLNPYFLDLKLNRDFFF